MLEASDSVEPCPVDGWLPWAQRLASPNFGPRPPGMPIDLIVVHSISLPPGIYGGNEVQQLFTNRLEWDQHPYFKQMEGLQVSAHFYIRRNGELWQFVSCLERAWHAGRSQYGGRENCNDFSLGIELEGMDSATFEDAQYVALRHLCQTLMQGFPISRIAGHEHIAPGRKTDPGPGFDWRRLRELLDISADFFPADVQDLL